MPKPQPNANLLPLPKAGEPIRESFVQGVASGINRLSGNKDPASFGLRWAIASGSDDFPYPAKTAGPIAYPFRWLYATASAANTVKHPIKDPAENSAKWRPRYAGGVDGLALNHPSILWHTNSSATTDTTQDYIHEHTMILVAYGADHYFVVKPDVDRLLFVAQEAIAAAEIDDGDFENSTFHGGDCHCFHLIETAAKTFKPKKQFFRDPESDDAGDARVVVVVNADPENEIESGQVFWGEKWAGGVWASSFIPCGS